MGKSTLGRAVIECGRGSKSYGGKGQGRWANRIDGDGEPYPPQKVPSISLRDNLRPLERWLKAQVGRSWNKVYSEFCAREDKRSLRGDHIHRHFKEMVRGSGGPEAVFLYQPSYQPPCWQDHGFWRFWISRTGILRHHTREDCARFGKKVGWVKGALQRSYKPYVSPLDTALDRGRSEGKLSLWELTDGILRVMDKRDREHPGWWLSPIRAAEVIGCGNR